MNSKRIDIPITSNATFQFLEIKLAVLSIRLMHLLPHNLCVNAATPHYQSVTAKRSPIIANRLIEQHDTIKAVYPAS